MSNGLDSILRDVAEMSRNGASEREIETEVVQVFKEGGWPRLKIKQDVPVSDRATDKADILLSIDEQPIVLVEVKRHGSTRDAEGQVKRYCALVRPKIAVLTDGTRWTIYLAGHRNLIPLFDLTVPNQISFIARAISALEPNKMQRLLHDKSFQYLDIIEQGFQQVSQEVQDRLLPHFITTAVTLLLPRENALEVLARGKWTGGTKATCY